MKKNDMDYQKTLDFLYTQLPMFQRVGTVAFKKDLTNTIKLCAALGNPHLQYPTIHIAGTNGKGSTTHLIAAALQTAGLKVGVYTSPHYRDFRERIKINGQYIAKEDIVTFVNNHKDSFEVIKPSFFEITVAMAFHYFQAMKVDIAVIETGLGGRLDSTNIINPLLSVITNISYDHMNMLGDTLPLIAGEKAGIIKKNIPVVIGEKQIEVEEVFLDKAKEMNAAIYFADEALEITTLENNIGQSIHDIFSKNDKNTYRIETDFWGNYQSNNIKTAFAACTILEQEYQLGLTPKLLQEAWKTVKPLTNYIGRWEILGNAPLVLADSGHNEAGINLILAQLSKIKFKQLHFVLGMVNDKNRAKILQLLPQTAIYYFAKAAIPRGLDATILQAEANRFGLNGNTYDSVTEALRIAKQVATSEDLIFIGGSTFVVAEVI